MPRKKNPEIIGTVTCSGCGRTVEMRIQSNKRLYFVCNDRRNGCFEHRKYSPYIIDPSEIDSFVPIGDEAGAVPEIAPYKVPPPIEDAPLKETVSTVQMDQENDEPIQEKRTSLGFLQW